MSSTRGCTVYVIDSFTFIQNLGKREYIPLWYMIRQTVRLPPLSSRRAPPTLPPAQKFYFFSFLVSKCVFWCYPGHSHERRKLLCKKLVFLLILMGPSSVWAVGLWLQPASPTVNPPLNVDVVRTRVVFLAYDDIQTALLLILGCAVHCDHRESFIENIQRLPVDIQESIVDCIKQVNKYYDKTYHLVIVEEGADDVWLHVLERYDGLPW